MQSVDEKITVEGDDLVSVSDDYTILQTSTAYAYKEGWNMIGIEVKKVAANTVFTLFSSPNWATTIF